MNIIKKFALTLLGVVAFGSAYAGEAMTESMNTMTRVDCTLLAEDVTINLSGGIVGGYDCSADDEIIIATCSTGGRTTSRSVEDSNGEVTTASGAEVPWASTMQGTVHKGYPGDDSTCDDQGATAAQFATDQVGATAAMLEE
ncbi:MAG: hypothetical protein ACLFQT_00305 [Thiohalophilus sp.]